MQGLYEEDVFFLIMVDSLLWYIPYYGIFLIMVYSLLLIMVDSLLLVMVYSLL